MAGVCRRDSQAETVSEAVLVAVAAREGVPEAELDPPLYEAIDPEALDAVFRDTSGRISFEYCGYRVTVDVDGTADRSEHVSLAEVNS